MPHRIYPPGFHVRNIGQSHFFPGYITTLTITLASNVGFRASGCGITVSGLTGAAVLLARGLVQTNSGQSRTIFTLDTTAASTASEYVGHTIRIAGETRTITAYTANRVITVSVPFSSAPHTGTVYSIILGGTSGSIPIYDTLLASTSGHRLRFTAVDGGTPGTASWNSVGTISFFAAVDMPEFQTSVVTFKLLADAVNQTAPDVYVRAGPARVIDTQVCMYVLSV
jgi:hypothetical protein